MKRVILFAAAMFIGFCCMAQEQLAFPFQGGKDVMTVFFKDSVAVAQQIIQRRASGSVTLKFTADDKGNISKIVIYYADDAIFVSPAVEALRKSNHRWVIANHAKTNDFILTVAFAFTPPAAVSPELQKAVFEFNFFRRPIFTSNQVPLDAVTLLPAITIYYDIPE